MVIIYPLQDQSHDQKIYRVEVFELFAQQILGGTGDNPLIYR
jgi:hypothetical protein